MNEQRVKDLLQRFGPPEQWLVSAEDIERAMVAGPCRHLIAQVGDCRECMPESLLRLQMAILAERLGCGEVAAKAVSDRLVNEFLEIRR